MYEVGFELHLIDGWDSKRQENMGWHKDMKIGICLAFFFFPMLNMEPLKGLELTTPRPKPELKSRVTQ